MAGFERQWRRAGIAFAGTATVATLVVAAVAGSPGPTQGLAAENEPGLFLPLVGRNQDYALLPDPPTPLPPTATTTSEATATDTPEPPTATPFVCPDLGDRVRVSAVDVHPDQVKVKQGRWDPTSPVFLAPRLEADGTIVAWADRGGSVHLTRLDPYDLRDGPDITLAGDEVRGLVAHGEGPSLLVVRGDELHFVRLDWEGAVVAEQRLVGGGSQDVVGSKWVDDWGHEARLVWAEGRYAVYSGHTQQFGARGKHQGDLLWFLDRDGKRLDAPDDWDWGCSHSLDLRLAHNGTRFGPVCLSDANPSPGFHFDHINLVRPEPSGDGAGYSAANLGGWVPIEDGFLMTFSSPEGRSSSDVGLLRVRNSASVSSARWLTETSDVDESAPHLAAFGDRLLAGWTAGADHVIAVVDTLGQALEGPVAIDAIAGAKDDFVTLPDGSVGWSYAWDDMSELKVVRVDWCDESAPPTVPPTSTSPATVVATATPSPPSTTPSATDTPGTGTPRPSRTPRYTSTPPGGTAAPPECVDVIANGGFEDGLDGWSFDGELGLRPSDRGGGRWAASLMGRNGVTASLSQEVTLPAGTVAAYVSYEWWMESSESETATRRFDWVDVGTAAATGSPRWLESLSNLSSRGAWRLSAHRLSDQGRVRLVFQGTSNQRDPTRIDVDQVTLTACSGSAPAWPLLSVSPFAAPAGSARIGSGSGFAPGEAVGHWLIEPGTLQRYDIDGAAADGTGSIAAALGGPEVTGTWRWGAVGETSLVPGAASFTVTDSQPEP